jgi:hypothetical protein
MGDLTTLLLSEALGEGMYWDSAAAAGDSMYISRWAPRYCSTTPRGMNFATCRDKDDSNTSISNNDNLEMHSDHWLAWAYDELCGYRYDQ